MRISRVRNHIGLALGAAAFGSLLAACAVGPNYKRPHAQLTPLHNGPTAADTAGRVPPPLDRWWTGFNDPLLVTVIERALDQNLSLAAAYARVSQSRAAASGAGAALLPTLDLNGSATAEKQSLLGPIGSIASGLPTFQRNEREFTVGPAASWEIDLFGGLQRRAAAARAEAQAAQADRFGTRVSVVADAADAYFQVRGYQARLAIAQNQISMSWTSIGRFRTGRKTRGCSQASISVGLCVRLSGSLRRQSIAASPLNAAATYAGTLG